MPTRTIPNIFQIYDQNTKKIHFNVVILTKYIYSWCGYDLQAN